MTERELLAHAGALPVTATADGTSFAALVRSPLLIGHVRSPGGAGGRRVSAGIALGDEPAFAVLVEGGGSTALSRYGNAVACAYAFADELRRASHDGLAARPAARPVMPAELLATGARLLG